MTDFRVESGINASTGAGLFLKLDQTTPQSTTGTFHFDRILSNVNDTVSMDNGIWVADAESVFFGNSGFVAAAASIHTNDDYWNFSGSAVTLSGNGIKLALYGGTKTTGTANGYVQVGILTSTPPITLDQSSLWVNSEFLVGGNDTYPSAQLYVQGGSAYTSIAVLNINVSSIFDDPGNVTGIGYGIIYEAHNPLNPDTRSDHHFGYSDSLFTWHEWLTLPVVGNIVLGKATSISGNTDITGTFLVSSTSTFHGVISLDTSNGGGSPGTITCNVIGGRTGGTINLSAGTLGTSSGLAGNGGSFTSIGGNAANGTGNAGTGGSLNLSGGNATGTGTQASANGGTWQGKGGANGSTSGKSGAAGNITLNGGNGGTSGTGGDSGSINLSGSNAGGAASGAAGGSITATASASIAAGSLNMSAGSVGTGGSINVSGGASGAGGSITMNNDGGSINTTGNGTIGLGASGTRTTLNGSGSVVTVTLPAITGTLMSLAGVQTITGAKTFNTANVTITDVNVVLGTTTGTIFGTATTQKLAFYNSTPIVQPLATTDLGTVLSNLGLRAAGTAYPITTSGAVTLTGGVTINTANLTITDVDVALGTTTGTKFGTATTQKLGFWNAAPIVQPTTAIAAATFVANTSGIANDTATWDSYTIGQVVKALRNEGLLA